MPNDLEMAANMTCGALNNPYTRPTIIIVDALNQVKENAIDIPISWQKTYNNILVYVLTIVL